MRCNVLIWIDYDGVEVFKNWVSKISSILDIP